MNIALPQLPPYPPRPGEHAREKCGVFGVWGSPHPATDTYLGLYALQHRGQESAGIAVSDGRSLARHADMGLVANVFSRSHLDALNRAARERSPIGGAIGHNRYSTTGRSAVDNAQPMISQIALDHGSPAPVAIAHNGNITNAARLRRELEARGHPFHTDSDTEVILHLLADAAARSVDDPLAHALEQLEGAFSLMLLHPDRIEIVRDPHGWRPLVLGTSPSGAPVVASESVALDVVNAELDREIQPGEILTISDDGLASRHFSDPGHPRAHCVFEHVYLASPASKVFGQTVILSRQRTGTRLAQEAPADADLVVPMPDSGRSAAIGYARALGLPFQEAIIPNRYVGRSFIKPTGDQRDAAVRLKLNVVSEIVAGQRIVIVDDSIVRGTTTKAKMTQLRAAGAVEIHLRIASPPITNPCFFGIDFASPEELIARDRSEEQIAKLLGVESVRFLSLDGLVETVTDQDHPASSYCAACFTGHYPIGVDTASARNALAC